MEVTSAGGLDYECITLRVCQEGLTIDGKHGMYKGWFVWFDTDNHRPQIKDVHFYRSFDQQKALLDEAGKMRYANLVDAFKSEYGWGQLLGRNSDTLRLYPPGNVDSPSA